MNLIILTEKDRKEGDVFGLTDSRAEHIRQVLQAIPGKTVEVEAAWSGSRSDSYFAWSMCTNMRVRNRLCDSQVRTFCGISRISCSSVLLSRIQAFCISAFMSIVRF